MARYLYSELSSLVDARKRCQEKNIPGWFDRHTDTIEMLVKEHMPRGSGFDSGTKLDLDRSHAEKLVFITSFHHMDSNGYYAGWTEHTVTVTPSLRSSYHLRISGRNRNNIKELIELEFDSALSLDVTYDLYKEQFPELQLRHTWEDKEGNPSQCTQAIYVGEKRFWNDYEGARAYACEMMQARARGEK